MDPEFYVFDKISSPVSKIAASTAVFAVVIGAAGLLTGRLPGAELWSTIDRSLALGSLNIGLARLVHLVLGYAVFIYASFHAWRATRLKNSAEDPQRKTAARLLTSGCYAGARHPMYGMFALANAGLGLALDSVAGLVFALLSLGVFYLNGVFEERYSLIPAFGWQYREYMQRVPARLFTRAQSALWVSLLLLNLIGIVYR